MKLFIILTTLALSNGAKLDRTYLPPNAQSSGGSGNILDAPLGENSEEGIFAQNTNGFAQNNNNAPQNFNGFSQNNAYDQETNGFARFGNANSYDVDNGFANFGSRSERPQASLERNAGILRYDSDNNGDSYAYAYETENGISADEQGVATNGVEAQGGFSYTGDDGQVYSIRYTADQNGFVPQGDHIPTPPPVPEEILKALEQNARDEAAGIFDDGSYNDAKYGNANQGYDRNANQIYNNIENNFVNRFEVNNPKDDEDTVVVNSVLQKDSLDQSGDQLSNQAGNDAATNKQYLPPVNQGAFGSRNAFSRRQPSFNSRTGYNY